MRPVIINKPKLCMYVENKWLEKKLWQIEFTLALPGVFGNEIGNNK